MIDRNKTSVIPLISVLHKSYMDHNTYFILPQLKVMKGICKETYGSSRLDFELNITHAGY